MSVCLSLSVWLSGCLSACLSARLSVFLLAVQSHTFGTIWLLNRVVTLVLLSCNDTLVADEHKSGGRKSGIFFPRESQLACKIYPTFLIGVSRRHSQHLKQGMLHLQACSRCDLGGEEEQERRGYIDEPRLQSLPFHLHHHSGEAAARRRQGKLLTHTTIAWAVRGFVKKGARWGRKRGGFVEGNQEGPRGAMYATHSCNTAIM